MTLLMRYMLGIMAGLNAQPPVTFDPLQVDKAYLVRRMARRNGKLHFVPWDGFCGSITIGKPYFAKRVANDNGVFHYLIGNQNINDDGTLVIGKPYFAKRVANDSGVLHYLIGGKLCCYCGSVEEDATVTVNSSVYSGSFPVLYRPDIRATSVSLPAEVEDATEPVPGWIGWYGLPGIPTLVACPAPNHLGFDFHFAYGAVIRRCDMKVWLTQTVYQDGVLLPYSISEFSICNDVDDVIECDPLNVVRKMDLVNWIPETWASPSVLPFVSCTGEAADCTGAEYVELTIP